MADVTSLKGTRILVNVEEALLDVIVVAFHFGKHVFQGALLDVGKKNCPFGIDPSLPPGGAGKSNPIADKKKSLSVDDAAGKVTPSNRKGTPLKTTEALPDDPFHALKQRFTYFQQQTAALYSPLHLHSSSVVIGKGGRRTSGRGGARDQGVRMRRLRPRQVLCSQCRSICNENSDNVQNMNTKNKKNEEQPPEAEKKPEADEQQRPYPKRDVHPLDFRNKRPPAFAGSKNVEEYRLRSAGGVPGRMILRKRKPNDDDEDEEFRNNATREFKMATRLHPAEAEPTSSHQVEPETDGDGGVTSAEEAKAAIPQPTPPKEDCEPNAVTNQRRPVIKISFANPQGHDTVVEIPARPSQHADSDASAKAAKKALKKAKKEAQRKASSLQSPTHNAQQYPVLVPSSYSYPGSSPSPLSEATSNSPGMCVNAPQPVVVNAAMSPLRRHKHHKHHKMKRKRRRRTFSDESSSANGNSFDGLQQDENRLEDGWGMVKTTTFTVADIRPSDGLYEEVRNNCLRQKLSISLKRLSARAYARCSPKPHRSPTHYVTERDDGLLYTSAGTGSASDSDMEDVPDFPKHEPLALRIKDGGVQNTVSVPATAATGSKPTKLMMRITTRNVNRCALDGGREMVVGDIVWGKIHGFPWWPGKVLALSVSQRDNGMTISQQAHVAWFGSSTSSLMPCQQLCPFLLDFKSRYNRKKRGPYKEAIRQATLEAQQVKIKQTMQSSVSSTTNIDDSGSAVSSTSGNLLFVNSAQERTMSIKNSVSATAAVGSNSVSLVT